MRINGITNCKNPYFGALVFKPKSSEYLVSLGKKALSDVDVVGENLKNTEFYNLEIGKTPIIRNTINNDKMYPPYNLRKAGKSLIVIGRCGEQTISKKINLKNEQEVENIRKDIIQSETQILRTGKIVKYLDEFEKKNAIKTYNYV